MLTAYPDYAVTRPEMPPRSRLYALEPRGLGTPLVEGLPGYVLRLAAWHQVPVALLLESELLPRLPTPLPPPGRHGHWHTFRRVLSSFTPTTAQWVQVLADLTGRSDLTRLTLLPWQAVLPPATLRRHAHAWCPHCYAHWHAAEQPQYIPLIWQIAAVRHCPQHGTPLQEQCPACGQPQPTLAWRTQLGVCRQCQAPLGLQEPRVTTATASPWDLWVTAQVGMLVTHPPPQPPTRRQVMDVIQDRPRQHPHAGTGLARNPPGLPSEHVGTVVYGPHHSDIGAVGADCSSAEERRAYRVNPAAPVCARSAGQQGAFGVNAPPTGRTAAR